MAEELLDNSISPSAADRLIAAHDGDVALLYLYGLRNGNRDEEAAARALCRTLQEIRTAEEKLQRMGLGGEAPAKPAPAEPAPPEELPAYTAGEISRLSRGNASLTAIYEEAASVLGRTLSPSDLRVLFGMYDHLALPPEVILVLLHYCTERAQQSGEGRRVSSRNLEQEAYAWANREILTLEQAEEYIRFQRQRHSELGRIQARLGLNTLSPTQEKDLRLWLDQGFGEEAIAIAADRTVTNTNALKWSYLRKILLSWQEKGLHSPAEIEEKDPARSRAVPAPPAGQDRPAVDREKLKKIIGKI